MKSDLFKYIRDGHSDKLLNFIRSLDEKTLKKQLTFQDESGRTATMLIFSNPKYIAQTEFLSSYLRSISSDILRSTAGCKDKDNCTEEMYIFKSPQAPFWRETFLKTDRRLEQYSKLLGDLQRLDKVLCHYFSKRGAKSLIATATITDKNGRTSESQLYENCYSYGVLNAYLDLRGAKSLQETANIYATKYYTSASLLFLNCMYSGEISRLNPSVTKRRINPPLLLKYFKLRGTASLQRTAMSENVSGLTEGEFIASIGSSYNALDVLMNYFQLRGKMLLQPENKIEYTVSKYELGIILDGFNKKNNFIVFDKKWLAESDIESKRKQNPAFFCLIDAVIGNPVEFVEIATNTLRAYSSKAEYYEIVEANIASFNLADMDYVLNNISTDCVEIRSRFAEAKFEKLHLQLSRVSISTATLSQKDLAHNIALIVEFLQSSKLEFRQDHEFIPCLLRGKKYHKIALLLMNFSNKKQFRNFLSRLIKHNKWLSPTFTQDLSDLNVIKSFVNFLMGRAPNKEAEHYRLLIFRDTLTKKPSVKSSAAITGIFKSPEFDATKRPTDSESFSDTKRIKTTAIPAYSTLSTK